MKLSLERAIGDAQDMLAKVAAGLDGLNPAEAVDIANELKKISKLAAAIVDGWEGQRQGEKIITKDGIRQLIRPRARPTDPARPTALIVMGAAFKAVFSPTTATWIDRQGLDAAFPDICAKFTRSKPAENMRFEGLGANGK